MRSILPDDPDRLREELRAVRTAKKQFVGDLFDETFKSIFVDPVVKERKKITDEDKKSFVSSLEQICKHVESKEFQEKHDATLNHLILDPNLNETYVVESIQTLLQGDIEGSVNGEYWNDYNQDEPLEAHPKCVGDTSKFSGIEDHPVWMMLDVIERRLLEKLAQINE